MMNDPEEVYDDPLADEYYTYTEEGSVNHSGKSALVIVGYFLLLAVLVYPAEQVHLGIVGIFGAMIGAGLLLAPIWLTVRIIRRKVEAMQVTGKGFVQLLVGYQPELVEEEDGEHEGQAPAATSTRAQPPAASATTREMPTSRDLVAASRINAQPYQQGEGELPEVIIEENPMYLSDTYQPNVNSMLSATVLVCGRRRSGKSNAIGVLAEELGRYYTPLLLGDTEDEYSGLINREFLPRAVMAGSLELYQEARASGLPYIPIDREGAYEFGKSIPRDVLQVVLNLPSFADDDEAALVMSEIIDGMNDWQQARPNSARVPCMFLLDEANKWLPQNITESCIQDRDVLYLLQQAIFGKMVRRGGKRGLGVVLTTQRIAELDKRAMQSIWKFLFQQGEEVDIARYAALGLDKEEVLSLQQGECFIFSPSVIGFRAMIRPRVSPHLGHTPGLAQLAAHLRRMPPVEIVSARRYTSIESRIESGEREGSDPSEEAGAREPARSEAREKAKTELERALSAWNALVAQGIAPSGRKLAAAMGISEGAGNRLMNALKAKGVIVETQKGEKPAPEDE